jgi:hypothetical protein
MNEPIDVEASFGPQGAPRPSAFHWHGRRHRIRSLGRSWIESGGVHLLVMTTPGRVFELLYQRPAGSWHLVRPASLFRDSDGVA